MLLLVYHKIKKLLITTSLVNVTLHPLLAQNIKNTFEKEDRSNIEESIITNSDILTENHIKHLPPQIQKYLYITGCLDKPKVLNACLELSGKIRKKANSGWASFKLKQYSFYNKSDSIFNFRDRNRGIFDNEMHKVFSRLKSDKSYKKRFARKTIIESPELTKNKTVSFFNEMCLLAPATLISSAIEWKIIDNNIVKARYTNENTSISASLFFNDSGELINFFSYDKHEFFKEKISHNYPWSTPVNEYCNFNGYRLPAKLQTIFHRPGSDFVYGIYSLKGLRYNFVKNRINS